MNPMLITYYSFYINGSFQAPDLGSPHLQLGGNKWFNFLINYFQCS